MASHCICSNIQEHIQRRDLGFSEEHGNEFFLRSCLQNFSNISSMLMKLSMMYTLKKKCWSNQDLIQHQIIFLFSFNSRSAVRCQSHANNVAGRVRTHKHTKAAVSKFFLQKPSIPCITVKVSPVLSSRGRNLRLKYLPISVIMKDKLLYIICKQCVHFLQKIDLTQRTGGNRCHRGLRDPHKGDLFSCFS